MARHRKIEIASINLRIPEDKRRDYGALLEAITATKKSIRVRGDTFLAIQHFDPKAGRGIVAKFTEIDVDGDWFDLEAFDAATPDQVQSITIPDALRPNLAQFYFTIDVGLHVVAFEIYSGSKGLSPASFEKYLKTVLYTPEIRRTYGIVEADLIKDYGEVERILALPNLKELGITIRPPNSDDIGRDLARVIEERLAEQNGREYEERIKAKPGESLAPNERTHKLALIGAENGEVDAKSLVNGIMTPSSTEMKPLTVGDKFGEDESDIATFNNLAGRIFGIIRRKRGEARG